MPRKKSHLHNINHQIFSTYSLIVSCVYLLRILFELATQSTDDMDVQWQVVECLFVVFGVLISIALHNAYDTRISLISISWTLWMFINTLFALFIVNSDIIQMVIDRIEESLPLTTVDLIKLVLDILQFFNIPISLYFICVFLVTNNTKRRKNKKKKRSISEKPILKKQFEVANVYIGDEMVYYV